MAASALAAKAADAPPPAFEEGEKILSYHGPLLYDAVITKRKTREVPDGSAQVWLYFIHYTGWKKSWDEWVPENRLLKFTDESVKLCKEKLKEFQKKKNGQKKQLPAPGTGDGPTDNQKDLRSVGKQAGPAPASTASSAVSTAGNDKKRKAPGDPVPPKPEEPPKGDESAGEHTEIKLPFPQSLKLKLVEDWEAITREKKLVPLPCKPAISQILNEFLEAKAKRATQERLYKEVVEGIKTYFNQACATVLLYKFERKQYRDMLDAHKGKPLVEIYGGEHLLRLFVKFPELLKATRMDTEQAMVLQAKLMELLKFVQKNVSSCFSGPYQGTSSEYIKWWESEQ